MSEFSARGIGGYQSLSSLEAGIDLQEYDALLHRLYGALSHKEGFNPFLDTLRLLFRCDTATLGVRDRYTRNMMGGWFSSMPSDVVKWYMANMASRDPLLNLAEEVQAPGFCATNLDMTQPLDLSEPLVEEWRAVASLQYGACCVVHRDSKTHTFLTLARGGEDSDFSDTDITLLNRLVPHLRRVLDLHSMMLDSRQAAMPLVAAFDQLRYPLLICNTRSQVSYHNQAARDWLRDNPWLRLENTFLRLKSAQLNAEFSICLHDMIQASRSLREPSDQVLSYPPGKAGNDDGVTLVISALGGSDDSLAVPVHDGGAMISLHCWGAKQVVPAEALAATFSLAPAEIRICQKLCQGEDVNSIAQQVSRGVGTIRTQLKSIYRKTGTSRQAQLVALILNTLNRA